MIAPPLTALYVPGDRPDRFDKAVASGADAVVIDLEDAVARDHKGIARRAVADWLAERETTSPVWVRVNRGDLLADDLDAVCRAGVAGLWLPKCESADDVGTVGTLLGRLERERGIGRLAVSPLIESGAGVLAAPSIAAAGRVAFLQLGEVDLAVDLGVEPSPGGSELAWARGQVVVASSAVLGVPPLGPVSVETRDLEAYADETRALRRFGFFGRACIHPAQLAVVRRAYDRTDDELAWAGEVLDSLAAAGSGVAVDRSGRLLDEAVARRARLILSTE